MALPNRQQPRGMDLHGRRVGVFGMARSGLAAAAFLKRKGAQVVVFDQKPAEALAKELAELDELGVEALAGVQQYEQLGALETLIVSPGVPVDHPFLARARGGCVEIISEIELAWRFCPAPMVAVAGTNGKGSTTTILGEMLRAGGLSVTVAGNIGTPLISVVEGDWDVVVAEVSSFQLETIADFHPWAAILLNITPDHLDRHGTFEGYVAAKARLFKNMHEGDIAVVNVDNEAARQVAAALPFEALRVAAACKEPLAACVEGDELLVQLPSEQNPVTVCRRSDLSVRGEHYLTNALCAAVVARSAGCTADAIRNGVRSWRPVDHQLTEVAVINGVRYVDDSKATNPASAIADLNTVEGPVIVIAGGLTKGLRMRDFAEALARRARAAFLIGEGAGEIATDIAGRIPATLSGTLEEAVRAAHAVAEPGDTVILAPACASFDQFRGQAQRGERFAEAVRALGSGNKA